MKAQILKIAGVKSEKEFYKKYPSEAAFMKKHGKEFKKAKTSDAIEKAQGGLQAAGIKPLGKTLSQLNQLPTAQQLMGNSGQNKGPGFDVPGATNFIGGVSNAIEGIKAAEAQTNNLMTWANVSGVIKDAEISNAFLKNEPVELNRVDNLRNIHNANELYMPKGRNTDVYGQNGSMIEGNPTETSNNYGAGSNIYKDLEDPNEVKAYQTGGGLGGNYAPFLGGSALGKGGLFGGDTGGGNWLAGAMGGDSSYANAASMIPGPAGMFATMAARYFDPNPGRQTNALNEIASNQSFITNLKSSKNINNRLSSMGVGQNGEELVTYEDGGYMNPEYNPQLITMFGDHTAEDFADYAHKYRAGGHLKEYTDPSERAMETYKNGGEISSYALGGKLKSHWGGEVEDMSYNPYLPGSGMTAMIKGKPHSQGGVGISYGDSEGDYQEYAENGAEIKADIEAEGKEPVIEIAENGTKDTKAVIYGNRPTTELMANAFGNETVKRLAKEYPGWSMKKIVEHRTKDEIKATKNIEKAAKISNNTNDNTKFGKLDEATAKIIKDSGDGTLKMIADEKIGLADFQDYLEDIKQDLSYIRKKNVSAEAVARGTIKGKPITMKDVLDGKIDDRDPVTMNSPIKNPYANSDEVAKFGTSLRKAQGGENITEDQYNNFLKMYTESEASKGKANDSTLGFQKLYHKSFPQEALAAIQKTTKENGLSNKANQMGLTKEDILSGKNIEKILQSNEDKYFGPRTKQYMASVKSKFNKTPPAADIQLNELGGPPSTTTVNTTKSGIGVVPLKNNQAGDIFNLLGSMFPGKDNIPPIDQRQFAGEYIASAQNTPVPVNIERMYSQLDPVYRITNQKARNDSTASFRDLMRMNQYNPEAAASIFGRKADSDQTSYDEEFKTNQAIEQQIFGGNRAKINQDMATNLGLDRERDRLQSIADSKTREIDQKIGSSIADKNMKYDADVMKYKIQRNMFPQYTYDPSGRIRTQNANYKPVIPQIYGGKGTIQQVPVYKDGKIDHYEMIESGKDTTDIPSNATPPFIPGQGYAKNGKSILKNARNSSVVKAYKNL